MKRTRCLAGSDDDSDDEIEAKVSRRDAKGDTATGQGASRLTLAQLKFSRPLSELTALPRRTCTQCGKKKKYYCYDCIRPVHPEHHPTDLKLPLKLYIYKHFNEKNGRSTALHAAILSPDATVYEYPDLGPPLDPDRTLVLYPSPEAVPLSEVPDLHRYQNAVVIEATWQQSRSIARDSRVCQLKPVRLDCHRSIFWRWQMKDESYLATIEAIYFFFVEYHAAIAAAQGSSQSYSGEYDDLLFFYLHMYKTIQEAYQRDRTLEYTPRGRPDYIRYGRPDPVLDPPSEASPPDPVVGTAPAESSGPSDP